MTDLNEPPSALCCTDSLHEPAQRLSGRSDTQAGFRGRQRGAGLGRALGTQDEHGAPSASRWTLNLSTALELVSNGASALPSRRDDERPPDALVHTFDPVCVKRQSLSGSR